MRKLVILALALAMAGVVLTKTDEDMFERPRRAMVAMQIKARGISDPRILDAMGRIPRHLFVPSAYQSQAYADHPLPIEEGQTISQPFIVALMTEHLEAREGDRILEIGTGSGYQAAVLAELTPEVYSVEIRETLARRSEKTLKELGYDFVRVKHADGYYGWEEYAPFDGIMVTCAANHVPPPLLRQLKEGGRLIIPLGSTSYFQTLTVITKVDGRPRVRQVLDVRFVPMVGEAEKKKGR
ncbi:MAG: protein-L-isoaspartate(D-aspartate) O-methyltransferase [Acidobacteriota bacterium]|nr:protein-L-isoaspartate(D-aspartate) O-methyltransferase [Acidobacteriota bacterium]